MIETKNNQISNQMKFEDIIKQLEKLPPNEQREFCFWAQGYMMGKNQAS